MHVVYLIENHQEKLYIGYTKNLERRLESHNRSEGPDWTQGKGPWKLIYEENHETESEALAREKYIKSLKAGKRIKQILKISV